MAAYLVQFLAFSSCLWAISAEKVLPCEGNLTPACVGSYLSRSGCSQNKLADSSKLDPHSVDHFYLETPYFYVTENRTNITIKGISQAYVDDLFYNTTSGRAVLTLVFPSLHIEGDTLIQYYYAPRDEPVSVSTHYVLDYTNLTLSTVFNNYQKPTLTDSQTFSYFPVEPKFNYASELADAAAADDRVAFLVQTYGDLPYAAMLESFKYRGPALVELFTNYKLCNYGQA